MQLSFLKSFLAVGLTIPLAFGASIPSVSTIQKRDVCSDAPTMINPVHYGFPNHPGANYYCDTRWVAGLTVIGIEVWARQYQIKGIQFTFSDGKILV